MLINLFNALLLGLIQGFLEWLPVSSSGNIILISNLLGFSIGEQSFYSLSLSLHLGTLLAVVYKYNNLLISYLDLRLFKFLFWGKKEEISDISDEFFLNANSLKFLLVTTFFTGLIGLPLYHTIKGIEINLLIPLIGLMLILTGIILKKSGNAGVKEVTTNLDMIIVGLAQGIAVLPGISRSGMTVSALLFREVKSNRSLELSFLISIPAITGAIILQIIEGTFPIINSYFIIATLASFITSLIMMNSLLKIAKKVKFWKFCIIFGLIAFTLGIGSNFII